MFPRLKSLALIFFTAFSLNLIWENLHSVLYQQYQGSLITEWILIRATLADAVILLALVVIASGLPRRLRLPLIVASSLVIAVLIEWYALAHQRWAYASAMPIIPLIRTGITPTVQLALTGVISYAVLSRFRMSRAH